MTKIYTRSGDDGLTSTFGGSRLPKCHPRVEAYGAVDELNCVLGVARSLADGDIASSVLTIQSRLFTLGSDLATPPNSPASAHLTRVTAPWITDLEAEIDRFQKQLPPLTSFILPGGSPAAAALHQARAVCRRAERRCVAAVQGGEEISPLAVAFLNRLSDWLFMLARLANCRAGREDEVWESSS